MEKLDVFDLANTFIASFFTDDRGCAHCNREHTLIHIPANVKHWHGAAPREWFSHLAVEVPGEETSNEWLEAVSNEDYTKATTVYSKEND